jgi:TPR repeat protein
MALSPSLRLPHSDKTVSKDLAARWPKHSQLGVKSAQVIIAMRRHLLFSVPILLILALRASALPQTGNSTQHNPAESASQFAKWTAADEREFLAKAQRGDASSQMWLGCAYEQGWLGTTNFPEALKWFRRSAEQGNPDAQFELGQMYAQGEGVAVNYALAAKWYRKAAEHVPDLGGAGQGRNNLGLLYMSGDGVPKDYVHAYMWFSLVSEANPNLRFAKDQMTPEQIRQAERLAAEWKNRHPIPLVK